MSRVFDFQMEAGQITLPGSGSYHESGGVTVGDGVWKQINLSGNYYGTPAVNVMAVSGSDESNTVFNAGANSNVIIRELKYTTGTWRMEIFGEPSTTVSYQVLGKTIDVQR